jgi:hypothetical protein
MALVTWRSVSVSIGGNDRKGSDRSHRNQSRSGWLVPLQNSVNKIKQHALKRFRLQRSDDLQCTLFMLVDQTIGLLKNSSLAIQLLDTIDAVGFAFLSLITCP